MVTARPLPETGSIHLDARGDDRALRVSWHHESALVVLSLWRDNLCTGSFRLAVEEVPDLIEMLRTGLDEAYDDRRRRRRVTTRGPSPSASPTTDGHATGA
ncbi:hypothetical protein [uncultured Nocardioides sp.]|uniref:hypothetical protein n=1 Tax=uncultured Nocardioides sp. TaxID=198441 RepID=UPI0025D8F19B|nr:hypothetical protein [uncultured Nocardioides sp.]